MLLEYPKVFFSKKVYIGKDSTDFSNPTYKWSLEVVQYKLWTVIWVSTRSGLREIEGDVLMPCVVCVPWQLFAFNPVRYAEVEVRAVGKMYDVEPVGLLLVLCLHEHN